MPSSASFRQQHDELLALATKLSATLDPASLAKDATEARAILTKLLAALTIHLTMEDKVLYPTLAKSADALVRETAVRFATEMGGIGEVVTNYKNQWSTAKQIQASPELFVKQTQEIINALGNRIGRENNDLYPLFDKTS